MNDEDIKILEILKETLIKDKFIIPKEPKKWCEAIENLLNRNKELEEIEQEHKKENGELREKVKELEEENTVLKKANNISENVTIKDITNFMNKSLEDFNKEYVPVAKIKEIFEKNKAITDCRYCNNTCDSYAVCMFCKDLLEEK